MQEIGRRYSKGDTKVTFTHKYGFEEIPFVLNEKQVFLSQISAEYDDRDDAEAVLTQIYRNGRRAFVYDSKKKVIIQDLDHFYLDHLEYSTEEEKNIFHEDMKERLTKIFTAF